MDYVLKPINVTELITRVSVHLEIQQARKVEIEKQKLRLDLLQLLSHELINPISSGKSLFEMIKKDPSQIETFSEIMDESFEQALILVDLARKMLTYETNREVLETEWICLEDAVTEACKYLEEEIKKKKITLNMEIDSNIKVLGEWARLVKYIIQEIIYNAIKFSAPDKTIFIDSKYTDEGIAVLRIKDQGIGIPKTIIQNLFDASKATHRDGTMGEKGTGFGLSLARNIVKFYGGDMEVNCDEEDSEGKSTGTTVTVLLKGKKESM